MFSAATHVDRTVHQNYRVRSVLDPGTSLLKHVNWVLDDTGAVRHLFLGLSNKHRNDSYGEIE
jgi:hypothetical protein